MSSQLLKFNNRCIDQVINSYLDFYPIPKNDDRNMHVTKHAFFSVVGVVIMTSLMFAQLIGLINYNFSYFVLCMRSMFSLLNLAQGLSPNINFTIEKKNWYVKLAVLTDALLVLSTLYILIPIATYNMFFNVFSHQTTLSLMSLIKSNILIGILSNLQTCLIPSMLIIGTLYGLLLILFVMVELHLLMFSIIVSTMSETSRTSWENSVKSVFTWLYSSIHKPLADIALKNILHINSLNNEEIFNPVQIEQLLVLLLVTHPQQLVRLVTHPQQLVRSPTNSNAPTRTPSYVNMSPTVSSVQTSPLSMLYSGSSVNVYDSCLEHINHLEPHTLTEDFICSICHNETHMSETNSNQISDVEVNSVTSDVTSDEDMQQMLNAHISISSNLTTDRGDHVRLNCSHIFHRTCIRQSVDSGLHTCPNCRTNIV